jgi:hypothetical protein
MDILNNLFSETEFLSVSDILINILFSGMMAFLVRTIYIKYGNSLSNRKQFSSNFFLITISTTLIVSIIQTSLALSLGLVGALSIVRFRNAIKEPEELSYLFFCITLGLAFGANKRLLAFLVIRSYIKDRNNSETYNLNIVSSDMGINKIIGIIRPYCNVSTFRRFDSDKTSTTLYLSVEIDNVQDIDQCVAELKSIEEDIKISFIPNKVLA